MKNEASAPAKSELGVDSIKNFLKAVFERLRMDRDGDGKISKTEFVNAALQLLPEFFFHPNLLPELRDLTKAEISEIFAWVGEFFPDYEGLKDEIEVVIKAASKFAAASLNLVVAIKDLQNKKDNVA